MRKLWDLISSSTIRKKYASKLTVPACLGGPYFNPILFLVAKHYFKYSGLHPWDWWHTDRLPYCLYVLLSSLHPFFHLSILPSPPSLCFFLLSSLLTLCMLSCIPNHYPSTLPLFPSFSVFLCLTHRLIDNLFIHLAHSTEFCSYSCSTT